MSQRRHLFLGLQSWRWKGTQLSPMAATDPQEVGFLWPPFRWAQNRHLLPGSCLSQLPWSLMEMEARSELLRLKHLVTSEGPEVSKIHGGSLQA